MKNPICNCSLLSLTLMSVSALTAAIIPSRNKKAINDRSPNNGIAVLSTIGGVLTPMVCETVVFSPLGNRSYTRTALSSNPCQGSGTSQDDDGTFTSCVGWTTYDRTTPAELENIGVLHDD